jgi:hypothetical protein
VARQLKKTCGWHVIAATVSKARKPIRQTLKRKNPSRYLIRERKFGQNILHGVRMAQRLSEKLLAVVQQLLP